MCAVSMVTDYYQHMFPQSFPLNPAPWQSDPAVAQQLLEVLRRLDAIDKRLNDRECLDEAKARFIKDLEAAAAALKTPPAKGA